MSDAGTEQKDGATQAADAWEQQQSVLQKGEKLVDGKVPEIVTAPGEAIFGGIQARDDQKSYQKAVNQNDYYGQVKSTVDEAGHITSAVGGAATILSKLPGAAGSMLPEVAEAAGPAGLVIGAAAGGLEVGDDMAQRADNKDYAQGQWGYTADGKPKTAMDRTTDAGNAANQALGGGTLGAIGGAATAGAAAIPYGIVGAAETLLPNPKVIEQNEYEGNKRTAQMMVNGYAKQQGVTLPPTATPRQMGLALSDVLERDKIRNDPDYAAMTRGAESIDPNQDAAIQLANQQKADQTNAFLGGAQSMVPTAAPPAAAPSPTPTGTPEILQPLPECPAS